MEKNKIIEHLKNHNYHEEKIQEAFKLIDQHKDRVVSLRELSGINYEKEMISSNKISDPTLNSVLAIENINKELIKLTEKVNKHSLYVEQVHEWLDVLSRSQRVVIELFYIKGMRWDRLSKAMGYSVSHCKAIRKKAIDRIESI